MSERSEIGFDDATRAQVDALVQQAVAERQAPGVVAAVARGRAVHVATAGVMAVGGPPVRRDTQFRITSMTKPMTAAAVLAQAEAGLLDLDEPVDRLLPELAGRVVLRSPDADLDDTVPARRPVTARDLLTFTWGLGMQGAMFLADPPWPVFSAAQERDLHTFGPPLPGHTADPDTWLARLAELPLLAQPGERWLYNSGSQVLGVLAARADRAPFDDVLRERVLGPLGMSGTAFHAADPGRLATAYARRGGEFEVTDPPDGQWARPPVFPDGSGGLVSTVDDVVAFGRMLLAGGGPVLSPATVAQMTTDRLTPQQRDNVWPGFSFLDDDGWGYGVAVGADGRYGWDGGGGTTWKNVPDRDLTVVVLTQCEAGETGLPAICRDLVAALVSGR